MTRTLWEREWDEHCNHEGFRIEGWPQQLLVGFSCSCDRTDGNERVWQIPLSQLRRMPRECQERFQHLQTIHPINTNPINDNIKHDLKRAVAAEKRAAKLLRRHLDTSQKSELRKLGFFTVMGMDGHTYKINKSTSWNVERIENNKVTAQFCIVFMDWKIPVSDKMLIQKFMLQSNIDDFFRISNKNHNAQLIQNGGMFEVINGEARPIEGNGRVA